MKWKDTYKEPKKKPVKKVKNPKKKSDGKK